MFAGGNLYVKRAITNTQATTLEALQGDMKVAEDFGHYLKNRQVIDALIALDPASYGAAATWPPLAAANDNALVDRRAAA